MMNDGDIVSWAWKSIGHSSGGRRPSLLSDGGIIDYEVVVVQHDLPLYSDRFWV